MTILRQGNASKAVTGMAVDGPAELSSRPERTRISCYAALDKAACGPFRKEGPMKFDNATKFHRKSGGAQWRDLRFLFPVLTQTIKPRKALLCEEKRCCLFAIPRLSQ
jgi:hypothetical protein